MLRQTAALMCVLGASLMLAGPASAQTTAPPRAAPKPAPALTTARAMQQAVPRITAAHKAVYRSSVKSGKDLRMFAVVGDCNSQPSVYLGRVASGEYDVTKLGKRLQQTVAQFQPSFPRVSLAAGGGFRAGSMMDPTWADGALCGTQQGPFECEVWVSRAGVVFIELGTGDQYTWEGFESHYRPMIELARKKGVLPILVTKADRLEEFAGAPPDYLNAVVRRLAKEYGVPLLDFALAARTLPNQGLLDEGALDFHLSDAGKDLHILLTLQTLDQIWR